MVQKITHLKNSKGEPLPLKKKYRLVEISLREIAVFVALPEHPNICRYAYAVVRRTQAILYLEQAEYDLLKIITAEEPPSLPTLLSILKQILQGLQHIHTHGIIHCDLKPENILCFPGGLVKIADFGLTLFSGDALQGGSFSYSPPEVIHRIKAKPSTPAIDIWTIGIIAAELATKHPCFREEFTKSKAFTNPRYVIEAITQFFKFPIIKERLTSIDPENCIEPFIRRCLQFDPIKRPTAEALLKDRLFSIYSTETASIETRSSGGGSS